MLREFGPPTVPDNGRYIVCLASKWFRFKCTVSSWRLSGPRGGEKRLVEDIYYIGNRARGIPIHVRFLAHEVVVYTYNKAHFKKKKLF